MKALQAIKCLLEGKKIRPDVVGDTKTYYYIKDNCLHTNYCGSVEWGQLDNWCSWLEVPEFMEEFDLHIGDKLDIYKGDHPVTYDALQVVFVGKNYIVAENSVVAPYVLHRADFDKKILRVKKLDV